MKCKPRPTVLDFFRLPLFGDYNLDSFHKWAEEAGLTEFESERDECLAINTARGEVVLRPGDVIIKDTEGNFIGCTYEFFKLHYEVI